MSAGTLLSLEDVRVSVGDREIVHGITLAIRPGEKHAIMGPNGSGKSTLANALMGSPEHRITGGRVLLCGEDITNLPAHERARKGMFLGFQYPVTVPGVSVANFLRTAVKARHPAGPDGKEHESVRTFRKRLMEHFALLEIDQSFASRYLNEGFSGGEKKRLEILQMSILDPTVAVLDETDSGLDIDALRIVSKGINANAGPDRGLLLVTHYQRLLDYVRPNFVHVLVRGAIASSGGPELALELEKHGYESFDRAGGATSP